MRIAIVNDMAIAVEAVTRVVAQQPNHELAWVARDGAEAVKMCARDTPDLILMDLIMPGVGGGEAIRQIMAKSPCAILIVTATVQGNAGKVFEALGAGALDVVGTPVLGPDGLAGGAAALLAKIATIERLIRSEKAIKGQPPRREPAPIPTKADRLLVIGASAGGPAALATVLGGLPKDFRGAVVIVQHIDEEFSELMGTWLGEQSEMPVRMIADGDRPEPGTVLIAATNDHLIFIDAHTLGYTREPRAYSYRPSVDVFFESVVRHWEGDVVGVLLTGMGRDGAKGLKALREDGALTIAQDRATSAVYGMPKAAAEAGAAMEILPLEEIAPRLCRHFSYNGRESAS
jgi:chemotaxis response regulator CheB